MVEAGRREAAGRYPKTKGDDYVELCANFLNCSARGGYSRLCRDCRRSGGNRETVVCCFSRAVPRVRNLPSQSSVTMRKTAAWLLSISFVAGPVFAEDSASTRPLVEKIAHVVKQDVQAQSHHGFTQTVTITKMDSNGGVKKQEEKLYRTTWVLGKPYNELIQIASRDLTRRERSQEDKRRADFEKAVYQKSKPSGIQQELKEIRWWEIYDKYDFKILPSQPGSSYVLSFQPKTTTLPERNRLERVINHLTGTVWVDENFHVLRAEARLTNPVRFGLGVLATISEAEIQYDQRHYGDACLPASLKVRYKANIALFRNDHQSMHVVWKDPYSQDMQAEAIGTIPPIPGKETKR